MIILLIFVLQKQRILAFLYESLSVAEQADKEPQFKCQTNKALDADANGNT